MQLTESVEAVKYGGAPLQYPKFPMRFDKLTHSQLSEPPLLGEHTESILQETLGYSSAKIQNLRDLKVI